MALNIAVPMSGVGDLLEGFGLLSPISPVSIDFRNSMKNPLSPVGSESSGVSSLDLEDIKKQMPILLDENEEDGTSGSGKSSSNSASLSAASTMSTTSSRTCSTSSSSSSASSASDDYTNQLDDNEQKLSEKSSENVAAVSSSTATELLGASEKESNEPVNTLDDSEALLSLELLKLAEEPIELPLFSPKATKDPIFSLPRQSIIYRNRDILDLGNNIRPQATSDSGAFAFQFAELPETNNIHFFLQNRSQYHRLAPNGHVQEFRMATCPCCDFQYPVNTVGTKSTAAPINQTCGTSNLSNLNANQIYGNLQQQQQQQQQLRLQQQQLQMQYAYRFNNNNGNSAGREYNMYQKANSGIGGNGNVAGLQSSRFNSGVYGSANVSGGSLSNTQNGIAGSAANGGFFNNNPLGRDHFNHMAPMGMQYNNAGGTPKGISQPNGVGAPSQSSGLRQQQQQYDMLQQQKQYVNNYSLGSAAANSVAMTGSANAAVRLQQQPQSQQVSHYYKKSSSMRYGGGPAGGINNMPSAGPTGSNWKNPMSNNNAIQDTATKLFMELNKMQQQSPYYVPFQ